MEHLIEALEAIPPSSLDYQEWVNVGMALKHEGYSCDVWDSWSRPDPRYEKRACSRKWDTFKEGAGTIVTGGTIIELAKRNGWTSGGSRETRTFDWEDEIEYDGNPDVIVKDAAWLDTSNMIEAPADKDFDGKDQLCRYLRALFDKDEIVGYCVDAAEADGKWRPASKGVYTRTAGELLESIKKHKELEDTIGDYNHEAGVWIRFNPLDGNGVGNENVSTYKYALVESDSMEIEKQKALMEELKLPIAIMVHSGGKSVHAIVRINAVTIQEYRERVDYLYRVCEKNGLSIDKQNKNASRMSRMPGVYRGAKKQFIIAENIGLPSFEEWKDYIEDSIDTLPEIVNFASLEKLPDLAPELIGGILRRGHKMLIAGPSKAGKSFLLIELAICIANGKNWLGFECREGKVLYINLEVDKDSFLHRVHDVETEMQLKVTSNLDIWNLRGQDTAIDKLAPRLIRRAAGKKYDAIIFDPLYKINQGDENSASEMGRFFNQLDRICTTLNTSIICCHHHSKGGQGGKFAIDRASGSGVFARDPDALLDMIQIDPRDVGKSLEKGQTAWRIASTLREFQSPEDIDVIWSHPVHRITQDLKGAKPISGMGAATNSQRGNAVKGEKKLEKYDRFCAFVENWDEIDTKKPHIPYPTLEEAVEYFKSDKGYSLSTIKRWLQEFDDIQIVDGRLVPADGSN